MKRAHIGLEVSKRLIISLTLLAVSWAAHRIFSSIHEEVIGAVLFITIFSAGILYYFFTLFKKKDSKEGEYVISMFFVFFLTIIMFAAIYSEPIEDSRNFFLELGERTDLSFPDALYFSVTTITTLGFGDIVPVGAFRYIAAVEVLMGVTYVGSIVYFIAREFER